MMHDNVSSIVAQITRRRNRCVRNECIRDFSFASSFEPRNSRRHSLCMWSLPNISPINCRNQRQKILLQCFYSIHLKWERNMYHPTGYFKHQQLLLSGQQLQTISSLNQNRTLVHSTKFAEISNNEENNVGFNGSKLHKKSSDEKAPSAKYSYVSILNNLDLIDRIPIEDVRNFCFIAHVDHGKSSLSMRVLELTGNLGDTAQQTAWKAASEGLIQSSEFSDEYANHSDSKSTMTSTSSTSISSTERSKEQIDVLDTLSVEQQRGITVKTSTATMLYKHKSAKGPTGVLLLNMYDTPGHVDFGKEVTRTLQFVQGAVLLLDATQGIQAQTWSVYEKAKSLKPTPPELLIALTKIDLESARPINVALSVAEFFNWEDPDTILHTSARSRIGIKQLLDAVCENVPSPSVLQDDDPESNPTLRGQVVDSWYDSRGVNCLIRIVSGHLKEGDRISMIAPISEDTSSTSSTMNESETTVSTKDPQSSYSVQEVGILIPKPQRTGKLVRGQMGYVRFGLRDPRQAMPGTVLIYTSQSNNKNLILPRIPSGISSTKSVLYASVHPRDVDEFEDLCNAVDRLALNDTGLEVSKTGSIGDGSSATSGPFLGPGLRVGFQGLLHVEVFRQRLQDEFNIEAVVTPPKVTYSITIHPSKSNGLKEKTTKIIEDLSDWVSTCRTIYSFHFGIVL